MHTEILEYDHDGTTCQGYLAYDDSTDARRPGILVAHAWMGQDEFARGRAEELARMGYVGFALDTYGKDARPQSRDEARELVGRYRGEDRTLIRGRGLAALAVLRDHGPTDPKRIGAIGYCFGGTTVLELARSGADVNVTVSFHGALHTPNVEDAKRIKGHVLACHGANDTHPDMDEVLAFQKEMSDAGVDFQINVYGHARHGFTEPSREAYNENAERRSWRAMQAAFAEAFGA